MKLDSHIIELQSKILILERENEALSAKAEENLLLNRAFEEINVFDDIDNLLLNTLESISVLLDVQFSGIFDLIDKQFECISSYALFCNNDTTSIQLEVSDSTIKKLLKYESCYINKADSITFTYPETEFKADSVVIVPVNSEILNNRCFVFINDAAGDNVAERLPLFEKIVSIISAKLDRIYYQNELKKLNEQLEKKVAERTFELIQQNSEYAILNQEYKTINKKLSIAKEKAEESDKLKTAFLQNMSHEIRTPMNAIMGFSSLLNENFDNKSKLKRFSDIINQRCYDLMEIINDILDISKIESGQLPVNIEECNAEVLFSDISNFFTEYKKRIGKQDIQFVLKPHLGAKKRVIYVDKGKLKQILINLISNAFKFTEAGKIEGGCKIDKTNQLFFYVSDTGIGIPKDKQGFIFERFAQLNQISNKTLGGTGLGLSIVKGLIEILEGKIWLESEPGIGSTFYFTLPVKQKENDNSTLRESLLKEETNEFNFSNKSVLLVEDDYFNAEYLKEILIPTGIKITTTDKGNQAVQIVLEQSPDLVLMDIRLPDISGYEATRKIRKHKPQIKIIAFTAYAVEDEWQKAIDAGCTDYISKPVKREILLSMLNKHFQKG